MFNKRNEEQEWTRRGGAPGREREEPEVVEASAAPSTPAVAVPGGPSGPSFRPSAGDVNVSVPARTARPINTLEGHDVESLIGERTTFEGTLKSEGAIRVLGTVSGELESKSAILIEERAQVKAKLVASQITISGRVEGEVYCQGRVEIRPTGHVTGEIQAGALIVQEGAFFEGSSKMASTNAPAAQPASPGGIGRPEVPARGTLGH